MYELQNLAGWLAVKCPILTNQNVYIKIKKIKSIGYKHEIELYAFI